MPDRSRTNSKQRYLQRFQEIADALRQGHPHLGRRERIAGLLDRLPAVLRRRPGLSDLRSLGVHRRAEGLPPGKPAHDQRRDHLQLAVERNEPLLPAVRASCSTTGSASRGSASSSTSSTARRSMAISSGDHCDPNTLLDTYEMFAKFGLPLWITEITIGSAGDDGLADPGPRGPRHLSPLVLRAEDGRHHLVEPRRRHGPRQRRRRRRRPGRRGFQSQALLQGPRPTDQPRLENQPRTPNRTPTAR